MFMIDFRYIKLGEVLINDKMDAKAVRRSE